MDTLVLDIQPDGRTSGIHTDDFDLGFLGKKSVRRQSEIVFNEGTEGWDIMYLTYDAGGSITAPPLLGFASYRQAIRLEVDWLNACREVGVYPASEYGLSIALQIRERMVYENESNPENL